MCDSSPTNATVSRILLSFHYCLRNLYIPYTETTAQVRMQHISDFPMDVIHLHRQPQHPVVT